jgi:uncharacterized alkaline shock family protein YloU
MTTATRTPGKTTIAPEVLLTIVQLTVLKVPGVSSLSPSPNTVNRLFNLNRKKQPLQGHEGVRIDILDDVVYADLYVVLKTEYNVRDVSHNIQHEVERAISEMIGMQVGRVNIHIEDVDYPNPSEG